MSTATTVILHLHPAAPAKPPVGAECNGCGICCALETCPLARLRFWQKEGPCPALTWSDLENRYHCGLLSQPVHFWSAVPTVFHPYIQRLSHRWIAAGFGCDCEAETD